MFCISSLKQKAIIFFNKDDLTKKIFLNSAGNLAVRLGTVSLSIISVPIILRIVGSESYGVFLTWFSIVSWLNYFDFGLSHGIKNKLTTYLVDGEIRKAHTILSSTYFFLFSIVTVVYSIINIIWYSGLLNNFVASSDWKIFQYSLFLFSIQFVLQPINSYFFATHKSFITSLCTLISNLVILILCLIVLYFDFAIQWHTLLKINIVVPIFVLLAASFYGYYIESPDIKPRLKSIDTSKFAEVFQSSIFFIIIQIGVLVLFQTDNIIISRVLGNAFVAEFNVVHKLFSVATMIFTIVITPFWAGFAEANARRDYYWMLGKLSILKKMSLFFIIIVLPLLFIFSDFLLEIWLGSKVIIREGTVLAMFFYAISLIYLTYVCYFLNGVNKIRLQALMYIIIAVLNIPCCIYFGGKFGLTGIIFTNAVLMFFMAFILNFEIRQFFRKVVNVN